MGYIKTMEYKTLSKRALAVVLCLLGLYGCASNLSNKYFYNDNLYLMQEDGIGNSDNAYIVVVNGSSTIVGNLGCNDFNAKVMIDTEKQAMKVTSLASTRMFCNNAVMEVEREVNKALMSTEYYEVKDNVLYLKNAKKQTIMRFSKDKHGSLK